MLKAALLHLILLTTKSSSKSKCFPKCAPHPCHLWISFQAPQGTNLWEYGIFVILENHWYRHLSICFTILSFVFASLLWVGFILWQRLNHTTPQIGAWDLVKTNTCLSEEDADIPCNRQVPHLSYKIYVWYVLCRNKDLDKDDFSSFFCSLLIATIYNDLKL